MFGDIDKYLIERRGKPEYEGWGKDPEYFVPSRYVDDIFKDYSTENELKNVKEVVIEILTGKDDFHFAERIMRRLQISQMGLGEFTWKVIRKL